MSLLTQRLDPFPDIIRKVVAIDWSPLSEARSIPTRFRDREMTSIETNQTSWSKCETGSLGRYAERQKSRIVKRRIAKVVSVAAFCLISVLAWSAFGPQMNATMEPSYGGIVCSKVKASAKAHLAGTLDQITDQKIVLHLKQCPTCLTFMQQLGNTQARETSLPSNRERSVSTKSSLIEPQVR